ncbi:YhcN/YlaJ family sporulation lipoprotein [Neobacillus dielmonensis]|uniref:YhcN/YlaJ family sporulation lipoprotein n=1 Tax=Neobacillus dielmonensis TaxID=1347369 RepID=UPI0005A720C2|nr:YhcN/YlaJ family sporulation lipoprotein [Neobacillus dielmonensis]
MKRLVMIAMVSLFLIGCNNINKENNAQNNSMVKVKNTNIENVDRKTGQQISKRLVSLATSVHDVNDATAVVLGNYAIVGIDVNSKIDRSEVGTIKYSVAESLSKDPYGAKAIVVADADTYQRLKEVQADIKNGRPVQGIMEELADIAGRLMPEVPGNLITPSPKNATDQQDEKLPANQENKLKKEQEKQSNYQK